MYKFLGESRIFNVFSAYLYLRKVLSQASVSLDGISEAKMYKNLTSPAPP